MLTECFLGLLAVEVSRGETGLCLHIFSLLRLLRHCYVHLRKMLVNLMYAYHHYPLSMWGREGESLKPTAFINSDPSFQQHKQISTCKIWASILRSSVELVFVFTVPKEQAMSRRLLNYLLNNAVIFWECHRLCWPRRRILLCQHVLEYLSAPPLCPAEQRTNSQGPRADQPLTLYSILSWMTVKWEMLLKTNASKASVLK